MIYLLFETAACSQVSVTVRKVMPRKEAAGEEGPVLDCLPKAAAPKLGLPSALNTLLFRPQVSVRKGTLCTDQQVLT